MVDKSGGENARSALDGDLIEKMPDSISSSLDKLGIGEKVHIAVSGDVSSNAYGRSWLVATDKQVFVYDAQEDTEPSMIIQLSDVETAEIARYFGINELRLKISSKSVRALRFTNTLISKVDRARVALLELAPKPPGQVGAGMISQIEKALEQQIRCSKCGRLIPSWSPVCPACISKKAVISRLLGYVRPHLLLALGGLLMAVLLTFMSLAPPYLTKILIDDAIETANYDLLALIASSLVLIYLLRTVLSASRNYIMEKLGQRIMLTLRRKLYEHLQILSLSFYDKRRTGRIMSRVMSDTQRVQYFVTWGVQQLIVDILVLVSIGVILFTMNWELAIIVLAPVPVLVIGTRMFSRKIHGVYHRAWRRWSSLSAILADTIPGMIVVKAFVQEARERKKFDKATEDIYDTNMNIVVLEGSFFPAMWFIITSSAALIWWFGGQRILAGTLKLGVLIAFISYTWQFYGPVERLSNMSRMLLRATTSAERIFEVLDTGPEVHDKRNAIPLPAVKGHMKFENLSFAYETGETVLRNINLEIEPGQIVGLVGPSGAGKTTLVKLILRFYDPMSGRITMDGYDLREVKKESLRQQVGIVLQEPFLFSGSIAENMSYSDPESSSKDIIEASRAANIHNFVLSLPEAYDTEVGERGHRLSGGEKQRVSIARALLKDPNILILDEATSSVDTETESLIQEALFRLMERRTSIVIAHRLSTVRKANKIVVLDKGEVVEEGTHEQLLESGGLYSRLCKMQAALTVIEEK